MPFANVAAVRMVVYPLLGTVMESSAMMLITTPIVAPVVQPGDIFRGVMPFFYAAPVVTALLILFPSLTVWLP